MNLDPLQAPPLLTADLPGTGGVIKVAPEDFEVEEIPAYEPSGEGGFLYLWVEKKDMGAEYFIRQVARRLAIPPGEVGAAGLKDRRAITRQYLSVPESVADRLEELCGDGISLLRWSRHGNKLRAGHLRGNRFRILIRNVEADASARATAILARIEHDGLANFFGAQRFGRGGETAAQGFDLLHGRTARRISPFLRKLALSAAQSVLFNAYLARRVQDGLFRTVLGGEVLRKWPAGGMFVARDIAIEQVRVDQRETVPAGPIFGRKMFRAEDEAARRENDVLQAAGLAADAFHGFGKLLQGTRRANLIYVDGAAAVTEPEGLRLSFALPAGSYATILLQELMKMPGGEAGED